MFFKRNEKRISRMEDQIEDLYDRFCDSEAIRQRNLDLQFDKKMDEKFKIAESFLQSKLNIYEEKIKLLEGLFSLQSRRLAEWEKWGENLKKLIADEWKKAEEKEKEND